jgi:hypothetical protein
MNPIKKLYTDLTDEQVISGILEIKDAEITGIIPNDSIIRELCRESAKITGMDVSSNMLHTQVGILKEGAMRWLDCRNVLEKGHI